MNDFYYIVGAVLILFLLVGICGASSGTDEIEP